MTLEEQRDAARDDLIDHCKGIMAKLSPEQREMVAGMKGKGKKRYLLKGMSRLDQVYRANPHNIEATVDNAAE